MRTDDSLAAISRMPRGEGLRTYLQAAKSSVPRELIARAEAALKEFEQIVQGELGGWDGFEAVVAEWLPDAREKYELANRQLVFKGMGSIMGMRAEVQLDTWIYYPDASGERCDIAIIEGMVGLRRLRPSVQIPVAVQMPNAGAPRPLQYVLEDVDREMPHEDYPLLERFCSKPPPRLDRVRTGDITSYTLAGNEIGATAAADIFTASVARGGRPIFREPSDPPARAHGSAWANLPVRTLLMTCLLHEDIWPDSDPQLFVYDIHIRGMAAPDDPTREVDRMHVPEVVQSLGRGVARFRAAEVGRHVDIVQYVCDSLGWDSERLRGYRVRMQYPLLTAQYCIAFNPPPIRT